MKELDYVREELLKRLPARAREGLVGAMLLGSIGAGMHDETSDYDIHVIFSDEALAAHPALREFELDLDRKCDLWVSPLSAFRATDRASFEAREYLGTLYVIDEGGILARIVSDIVHYPPGEAAGIVDARLDGYYDGLFRSLKCFRHGFTFGAHQMAARGMEYFVETLWAVNGLIPPFINRAPLALGTLGLLPLPAEALRALMEEIAVCAEIGAQIALFDHMSAFMEERGHGHVLEAWEGVLEGEIARHRG